MSTLALVPPTWTFDCFSDLIDTLSEEMVKQLHAAVRSRGRASLVVPGGTTPQLLFDGLCGRDAPWEGTSVTVSDEEWGAGRCAGVHEQVVRTRLLRGRAASARFVPLRTAAVDPWWGEPQVNENLAAMPAPIDVSILGMTAEGGVGALLPGAKGLERAMRLEACPEIARAIQTGAGQGRMAITLHGLLQARWTAIVIRGEAKMDAYRRALHGENTLEMPVRALIRQRRAPVHVFWSP